MAATKTPYANSPLQQMARKRNQSLRNLAAIKAQWNGIWQYYPLNKFEQAMILNMIREQERRIKEIYEEKKSMYLRRQAEVDYFIN